MIKKLLLLTLLSIVSVSTFASVKVLNAKLSNDGRSLIAEISYGGGFVKNHDFSVVLDGGCRETFPVQCDITVVDHTFDGAERLNFKTVELPLPKELFTDSYYERAFLSITNSESLGIQLIH